MERTLELSLYLGPGDDEDSGSLADRGSIDLDVWRRYANNLDMKLPAHSARGHGTAKIVRVSGVSWEATCVQDAWSLRV